MVVLRLYYQQAGGVCLFLKFGLRSLAIDEAHLPVIIIGGFKLNRHFNFACKIRRGLQYVVCTIHVQTYVYGRRTGVTWAVVATRIMYHLQFLNPGAFEKRMN